MPFDRLSNARLAIGEVEFSGDVILDIEGVAQVANLHTERVGETFKLRFREDDIRAIAQAKGTDLVPEQIRHPDEVEPFGEDRLLR